MFTCLIINLLFHCETCAQDEFAEPVDFDVNNNKRFKSKKKGMLGRVRVLLSSFKRKAEYS